jgi:hypothetical protein
MGVSPFKSKSIFVFGGRKVLVREFNRFDLISIRLDEGRFIAPATSSPRRGYGRITWTDFTLLTEASVRGEVTVKYIDDPEKGDG